MKTGAAVQCRGRRDHTARCCSTRRRKLLMRVQPFPCFCAPTSVQRMPTPFPRTVSGHRGYCMLRVLLRLRRPIQLTRAPLLSCSPQKDRRVSHHFSTMDMTNTTFVGTGAFLAGLLVGRWLAATAPSEHEPEETVSHICLPHFPPPASVENDPK